MPIKMVFECAVIPGHESISKLAYQKWEEAGRPEGNDLHFWYAAEKELKEPATVEISSANN